ncbi:Histidine protein methyltransferase 1 [Talaromyces islandicus]|uniref:protein-histidine N-methyltransferase n=1 Tax=Talaromyces islandicus TaxID=28573 RepID=A0A0U1MB21_TALIS|nr:Histidine protein methyltransferase 1 [Talaromyces islandicus]
MASMFSFGFSGDDIEDEVDAGAPDTTTHTDNEKNNSTANNLPEIFPAEKHQIEEWTSSLPSQIAYSTLKLKSSANDEYLLGRREIFDVRTQLMAEDAPDHDELISGLEQGDLKPNFYEGGFKTWECALDLARLVLQQQGPKPDREESSRFWNDVEGDGFHVIELGCGTAVPTLALFARLLSLPLSSFEESRKKRTFKFTLADYNSSVLRMVTLPNLLLTWWLSTTISQSDESTEAHKPDEGELDIDSALLDAFQTDLSKRGVTIDFISGGWSSQFVDLVSGGNNQREQSIPRLVLASETIYSPSSLDSFSQTLVQLLRGGMQASRALVAAKKVYFGVGGGIDEFLHVLRQQPLQENEQLDTRESSEVTSEGVGRIILEINVHTRT